MPKITVQIFDPTNKQITVEVPDDKPIGDILQKLSTMLDWPRQGGRVVLHHKRQARDLDDSRSLAEQGVAEHDVLKLRIEAIPGAAL